MTLKGLSESRFFRPASAAALAIFCGLGLWATTLGEKSGQHTIGTEWEQASYDYLFFFGTPAVTNNIVLILMDSDSYSELGQDRNKPWDRALHARLLNKLADDGCPLVVMDITFLETNDIQVDKALADSMGRLSNIVLAADMAGATHPGMDDVHPNLPLSIFLAHAHNHWGLTRVDSDLDDIIRRHWPFPGPGPLQTAPWVAATLSGAHLDPQPQERWLRYYDLDAALPALSYRLALTEAPNYFHDKIVFVGNDPEKKSASNYHDEDKFHTPFTRWTEEGIGGVKIIATAYLNLVRGDWLRRAAWPVEGFLFIITGAISGILLARFSRWRAIGVAALAMIVFSVTGIGLSHVTNYWFPWLMIVGAQIPCALAVAILMPPKIQETSKEPPGVSAPKLNVPAPVQDERIPDAPDYELLQPPIGQGAFGKVWIARTAIGQWQALKAVYLAKFGDNRHPYDSEFKGLQKYKPVSEKHSGLLRVDFVSRMKDEGYFYYVMELGDAQVPGWERDPSTYKPRDLENIRKQAEGKRLPLQECIRIGRVLVDALHCLHSNGLTHRDIKPSNVIFVNGLPKLADIGLVTDIRPPEEIKTIVGTPGYMPPPPEPPGTPQSDIYSMGMLLYVISTGYDPKFFPDIATTIMQREDHAEFVRFDRIILKACQPDVTQRYQTALEMMQDLETFGSQ